MSNLSLYAKFCTARAFLRTRWLHHRLQTREDVVRWQNKKLSHFVNHVAPSVAAFDSSANHPKTNAHLVETEQFSQQARLGLERFALMDKKLLMEQFDQYNKHGITAEQGWHAMQTQTPIHGCYAGASTGTSGNRSLYLVNDIERYEWLGIMLGKALPNVLRERYRVAVILPANSSLYDAANEGGRLQLRFFDLHDGIDAHTRALQRFNPNVIVAPPKVLRFLAEADVQLQPLSLFSGAEVLDPIDRQVIEARFQLTVREIYMATEGLFGVACEHGTVHLAEDAVHFQWLPDPAGGDLKHPVITDFTRRTQLLVRYQMNDLLQLDDTACQCGSPLTPVKSIVGRLDDVFQLPHGNTTRLITPDILRNTVLDANRRIDDFRVRQIGAKQVQLVLPPHCENQLTDASSALQKLFRSLNVDVELCSHTEELQTSHRKLRRVERIAETETETETATA